MNDQNQYKIAQELQKLRNQQEPEQQKQGLSDESKTALLLIGAALAVILLAALIPPYFEAKAFNRLTGANVSYFEALFVELRVDCQNLKK